MFRTSRLLLSLLLAGALTALKADAQPARTVKSGDAVRAKKNGAPVLSPAEKVQAIQDQGAFFQECIKSSPETAFALRQGAYLLFASHRALKKLGWEKWQLEEFDKQVNKVLGPLCSPEAACRVALEMYRETALGKRNWSAERRRHTVEILQEGIRDVIRIEEEGRPDAPKPVRVLAPPAVELPSPPPPVAEVGPALQPNDGGAAAGLETTDVRLKFRPAVTYPSEAKEKRIQGTVRVEISVSEDGVPISAKVVEGPNELREYGESYAMQCLFEPALVNGKPSASTFNLTLPFRLR